LSQVRYSTTSTNRDAVRITRTEKFLKFGSILPDKSIVADTYQIERGGKQYRSTNISTAATDRTRPSRTRPGPNIPFA
jgi:hypothetical protein